MNLAVWPDIQALPNHTPLTNEIARNRGQNYAAEFTKVEPGVLTVAV